MHQVRHCSSEELKKIIIDRSSPWREDKMSRSRGIGPKKTHWKEKTRTKGGNLPAASSCVNGHDCVSHGFSIFLSFPFNPISSFFSLSREGEGLPLLNRVYLWPIHLWSENNMKKNMCTALDVGRISCWCPPSCVEGFRVPRGGSGVAEIDLEKKTRSPSLVFPFASKMT